MRNLSGTAGLDFTRLKANELLWGVFYFSFPKRKENGI